MAMNEHQLKVFESVFKFEDNKSYLLLENLDTNHLNVLDNAVSKLEVDVTTQFKCDKHSYVILECDKDTACHTIQKLISVSNQPNVPTVYFVTSMTLYSYMNTDVGVSMKPIFTKTSDDIDWFFKTLFLKKRVSMFSYDNIDGTLTYSID